MLRFFRPAHLSSFPSFLPSCLNVLIFLGWLEPISAHDSTQESVVFAFLEVDEHHRPNTFVLAWNLSISYLCIKWQNIHYIKATIPYELYWVKFYGFKYMVALFVSLTLHQLE